MDQTHELQARCLPPGLCFIMNADTNYVLPVDAIRNQDLGLLVGGQEIGMMRLSPVDTAGPFHGFGEQRFECFNAFLHKSSMLGRRIARTEFRAEMPQVVSSDKKYNPVWKQPFLAPRGPEVPSIGVLDGAAYVVRVSIQTPCVRRVQDRPLVFLEMARRKNPPGVVRDVRKIARGGEVA